MKNKGLILPPTNHKRPDRSFKEALEEARAKSSTERGGYDKRYTAMKLTDGEGYESSVRHPDSEQLELINRFTRTPKTAEEVVCFPTLSCNDIIDRDYEQFTADCIDQFASLEEPYSSVGKSFMVGHDYSKLPVGRIFDVGTEEVDNAKFLKNWVYLPNTDANKDYIENVDFGVYWAVSVGVVLEKSVCSIGEPHAGGSWRFCEQGHIRGLYYNAEETEYDDWGWPIESDPEDPNAELCFNKLSDPQDFYELSQVYLGAQYFAELSDKSTFSGIVKAASAGDVPIVGLSKEEAEELPIPHEPPQVREARREFDIKELEDGTLKWVDNQNLIWVYDPEEGKIASLGKKEAADAEADEEKQNGPDPEGDEPEPEQQRGSSGSGDVEDRSGGSEEDEQPEGAESVDTDTEDDDTEEEKGMSDKAVLAVARKLNVPTGLLEKATTEDGPLLDSLLSAVLDEYQDLSKRVEELEPQADVAEKYLQALKAEAIDWYTKARQTEPGKAVNVDNFQKLLERCGDDVDLIKSLIEEQKDLAKAKFPNSVRRSSFPDDPNSRSTPSELPKKPDNDSDDTVRRLHG